MIYLFFSMMFLNLQFGYLLFCTSKRTKFQSSESHKILYFYTLSTCSMLLCSMMFSVTLSAYIPLLIGFFYFLKSLASNLEGADKILNSIIIMCEMTLIYLKTGRSFDESIRMSSAKMGSDIFNFEGDKKNVVMQQPKSRKSHLFDDFKQDLEKVACVKVGKLELLESVKTKYDTFLILKQKTKTATTQYRAQSFTLIALWLLSLSSLIWQNKVLLYKNTVALSFIMMIAGLVLSRKILIKTDFRI